MAKAKPEAEYECVVSCTFNVPMLDGTKYCHFYKCVADCDDPSQTNVRIPAGTVVPKHFVPFNEQAKIDRADQIQNPTKYLSDKETLSILAGILVKEGMFDSIKAAINAIREEAENNDINTDDLGEASAEETRKIRAVKELMDRGKDDKERRVIFGKILKEGEVTFFAGAPPIKLAEKIVDSELYVEPK